MVSRVLSGNPDWQIEPIDPAEWPGLETAITPLGEFRTTCTGHAAGDGNTWGWSRQLLCRPA